MRSTLTFLIILAILTAGFFVLNSFGFNEKQADSSGEGTNTSEADETPILRQAQDDSGDGETNASLGTARDDNGISNEDHPQSLRTLMGTELDGSNFALGTVQDDNASYTRYTITYTSDGRTVSGILNVPKGEGPFPVLFLNHGFIDPSVYTNGRGLRREQDFFARNGYMVVHSDYRGHGLSDPFPEGERGQTLAAFNYTQDVLNAIVAVQNSGLEHIDAGRVGLLGHSMGGGISQNILVTHPELIDAVVLYAPVSTDYKDNFDKWRRPETDAETITALSNDIGDVDQTESFAAFSSRTYVDRIDDPVLIFHGTNDASVQIEWSEESVRVLQEAETNAELVIFEGEAHEFGPQWGSFMQQSLVFFNTYLQ